MLPSPILAGQGSTTWYLTLSANDSDVNLKTELEAIYGPMVVAVSAVVTISSGVKISSSSPGTSAMTTGTGWPTGSTLKIINNGRIGGAGGVGASYNAPGTVGGDALDIRLGVTIDNTYGQIFGGGGGGGPGGSGAWKIADGNSSGAGGGGQGDGGGAGGAGDTGHGASNGSAGSESGPGAGAYGYNTGATGGPGGTGGTWGQTGSTGGGAPDPDGRGYPHSHWDEGYYGGAGYAGGRAVRKNGKTCTWLGGKNTEQVKGGVS